jgi:phosphohistidine phosphatase
MHLYVIRHADAVPQGQAGIERDEDRPLTSEGQEQSHRLARALRDHGVKLDKILTSPLLRAKQTAEALITFWGDGAPPLEECEYLAPGSKKKKLMRDLLAAGGEAVAIVGHNPDLSELLCWLIGKKEVNVSLSKAGVACIEFEGSPCKECGNLAWLVTPDWYEPIGKDHRAAI